MTNTTVELPKVSAEASKFQLRRKVMAWASRKLLKRSVAAEIVPVVMATDNEPGEPAAALPRRVPSERADAFSLTDKPASGAPKPEPPLPRRAPAAPAAEFSQLGGKHKDQDTAASEYQPAHRADYDESEPYLAGKHRAVSHLAKHVLQDEFDTASFDTASQNPIAAEQGDAYQGRHRAEP